MHLRVEERASANNQAGGGDDSDDEVEQKHDKDIYVTAVRRKYIPPLMECYQDILIYSVFNFEPSSTEAEMARASKLFLRQVHQRVVDTLYPCTATSSSIYHQFVTQKANALLMDEQSMDFFEQQLNIRPSLAVDAVQYVKSIVEIFKQASQGLKRREYKAMIHVLD